MKKVFCFGELLLRLSPELGGKWISNAAMPVYVGGAELNVARALANWQVPVRYSTALPDHYLAHEISTSLEECGIDTSGIAYGGDRIGCYYLPQGADLKHAGVIYDRAYSSFSELRTGQLNWRQILQDVGWFHFSAISPALNPNVAHVCLEGLQVASELGIKISVDLNYRAKLWQYGKQPQEVMPELVAFCDLVMGNIWAKEKMLGIPVHPSLSPEKDSYLEQANESSKEIQRLFPNCAQVANTFRFDQGEGVHYYASYFENRELFVSQEHRTEYIVDKVGSGDCFMAGLIYGNYNNRKPQEIIDFAAAAAFNKLFTRGDASTATVEEIEKGILHDA
jgi:2-dehydro-3-deoxygluconokinase